MAIYTPSGNLIIANQTFHIEAPVINWTEPPFWDATKEVCLSTETERTPPCKPGGVPYGVLPNGAYTKRYAARPALRNYYSNGKSPPLDAVKSVIKQFVVHHDGCLTADMCFNVLQNERGLSVHFLLDNDGTIYQTIDLAWMAYHASEWNIASIGVEMCNRGDRIADKDYYAKHKMARTPKACRINGHTFDAWDYTPEQYDSFRRLARALTRLLPNLPVDFPQSSPGVQTWDTLPMSASFGFAGYIGHYHLTAQKWDPGPFDFKDFCSKVRGAFCFPVFAKDDPKRVDDQPKVPEQTEKLKAAADDLYKINEAKADGGFFPVGPWGESRLWHGGVHLIAREGAEVFSTFPGRLVAARMGPPSSIGSVNFVLLRHEMTLGKQRVQFYSLYMHLQDEHKSKDKPIDWITKSEAWKSVKPGDVALLDEAVGAGAVIGHVGTAGPAELSRAQIHVEFFSVADLFSELPGWQLVDGSASGRFCEAPEVDGIIDTDHDGMLSHQELVNFYSGGGGAQLHYMITLHVSEWTADPSWGDALRVPKDFKKLKPAEIDALVADQITPGLWWDAKTAAHCKLPVDGVVYHYHPISFVAWFNQQMVDAATASAGDKVDVKDAKGVPPGVTDDLGDKLGTTMRSTTTDVAEDPCNKNLTLKEMVLGYDAPECGP